MKKNKKILCIIIPTHWTKLVGGCQYQISLLLERWRNDENIVKICLSKYFNENDNIEIKYSISKYGGINKLSAFSRLFDTISLFNALKKCKPNVIYQNIGEPYAGVAAFYAKKYNVKFILHIASDNDLKPIYFKLSLKNSLRFLEKKFFDYGLKNANVIIAQTKNQLNLIKKYYRKNARYIIRNYEPYDEVLTIKKQPIKVLWVANFKKLKQPEIFIRLSKDIFKINNEAKFIMIGAPAYWDQGWQNNLEKMIYATKNISYLKAQNIEAVNNHFASCHILVNTSEYEGYSNTFVQAFFRKVPVVSLNCNPDNIFKEYNLGYYCNGSYEKLLEHTKELIINQKLRDIMGENARQYALKYHSINNADKLIKVIESNLDCIKP